MEEYIISLIIKYARMYDVDPPLAIAVAKIESNFNPNKLGLAGEMGVFQLHPAYHKEFDTIEPSIVDGIKTLKYMEKYCPYNIDGQYVVCYNLGIAGASKVRYPALFPYYKKVMKEYEYYAKRHYY